MKDLFYHIDSVEVYGDENPLYFIGGWCASPKNLPVELKVLADGKAVVCQINRNERADVVGFSKALKDADPVCGFEILIYDLDTIRNASSVRVMACYGNDSKVIFARSGAQIREMIEQNKTQVTIDDWSSGERGARIHGWFISMDPLDHLEVKNSRGTEVPFEISWKRRYDLEKIYHISSKTTPGFEIVIRREDLAEDASLQLVFVTKNGKVEVPVKTDRKPKAAKFSYIRQRIFNPTYWKRGWKFLCKNGLRATLYHMSAAGNAGPGAYNTWFLEHRITEEELRVQAEKQKDFAERPVISICVPLYNTELRYLAALIDSVIGQSYTNWELCLADGSTNENVNKYIHENYADYLGDAAGDREGRIFYTRLEENYGIAGNTNYALEMGTGDFIMLSDHDDYLEKDALFEIVSAINRDPKTDIIYTDEDLTDDSGIRFESPRMKPDFNMDMLCSINYICHIFVARASIMKQVGGFRKEYDGAQDWDMILRCCELSQNIVHIPKILYHWRAYEASTAGNPDSKTYAIDAGRNAVAAHFERCGYEADVRYTNVFILFQPQIKVKGTPKVSVIIPSYDHADLLKNCIDSILKKSTYSNYEIIVVENNSKEKKTFDYYEQVQREHANVRVVTYPGSGPFNYSAVNNFGASQADGEYLILLNNDTKVISPDWMENMIGYCQRENTGIVGAKLYFDDDTVQHCGVVIGVGGFAGHILTESMRGDAGYFGRLLAVHDVSAVTAACLMIKRSTFDAVGGLDEGFRVALNDVDLCMKVRALGQLVVMNPGVELYHFESKSRGYEADAGKHERFKSEIRRFRTKWKKELDEGDPYYNPHLTLMYGDCRLRTPDEHFDIIDEILREDAEAAAENV
jgi:GT2 family glycosyltransferase